MNTGSFRPNVSVCMATYNGANYVAEQLTSILGQLSPHDEVVIVDDGSKDSTVAVIEALADPRIRVLRNETNRGVVASFGRAIEEATGEIIFLSDQDDLWLGEKVSRVLTEFLDRGTMVVVTDAYIFDEEKVWLETFFEIRKSGPGLVINTVRNSFIGCCMAFRAELKESLLPLPANLPMHDWWIGLLGSYYGKAVFLDTPLIAYRRHAGTATTVNTAGIGSKLKKLPTLLRDRWRITSKVVARVAEGRPGSAGRRPSA